MSFLRIVVGLLACLSIGLLVGLVDVWLEYPEALHYKMNSVQVRYADDMTRVRGIDHWTLHLISGSVRIDHTLHIPSEAAQASILSTNNQQIVLRVHGTPEGVWTLDGTPVIITEIP